LPKFLQFLQFLHLNGENMPQPLLQCGEPLRTGKAVACPLGKDASFTNEWLHVISIESISIESPG
jgi:hypothetical protein